MILTDAKLSYKAGNTKIGLSIARRRKPFIFVESIKIIDFTDARPKSAYFDFGIFVRCHCTIACSEILCAYRFEFRIFEFRSDATIATDFFFNF